jgi:hypothetical protein
MLSILKKAAVPIVLAVLVAGVVSSPSNASTKADAKGSLTVWVMGDSGMNFQKLVAPFTKSTGIGVKVVAIPWGNVNEKLTTAIASGTGPDVVQIGLSSLRTFADAGALMPLDKKLSAYPGLATTNFAPGVAGKATAIQGLQILASFSIEVIFCQLPGLLLRLKRGQIGVPMPRFSPIRQSANMGITYRNGMMRYHLNSHGNLVAILPTARETLISIPLHFIMRLTFTLGCMPIRAFPPIRISIRRKDLFQERSQCW